MKHLYALWNSLKRFWSWLNILLSLHSMIESWWSETIIFEPINFSSLLKSSEIPDLRNPSGELVHNYRSRQIAQFSALSLSTSISCRCGWSKMPAIVYVCDQQNRCKLGRIITEIMISPKPCFKQNHSFCNLTKIVVDREG